MLKKALRAAALSLAVIVAAPALTGSAIAASVGGDEGSEECLDCHDDEGMEKDLADGGTLSLHVAGETFFSSVHADEGCAGCHGEVDLDVHPEEREIASLDAYRGEMASRCRECHFGEDDDETSMHGRLVSDGEQVPCTVCHGPHDIEYVSVWKETVSDREYCLGCHEKGITLGFSNGEEMSFTVTEGLIDSSVHEGHECSDCHEGFGKGAHSLGRYSSRRGHSITLSKLCRQCHDDEFEVMETSIHYKLRQLGNLAAPVCTDCHGFHEVGPRERMETLAGVPCQQCHTEVFEAFRESWHGQVDPETAHMKAPVCADCHHSHGVQPAFWMAEMKEACIACHGTASAAHERWLPNAGLHLDMVACPACHAPLAARAIQLVMVDGDSGRPLRIADLGSNGEGGESRITAASVDGLDAVEIWNLLRRGDGYGAARLQGLLTVRSGIDAHTMAGKGEALRDCKACHLDTAEPYRSVSVSLLRQDGRPLRFEVGEGLLQEPASVATVGGFYLAGGTRMKFLDLLLIAAVLGGMSVPALHMSARLLLGKK